jgi:hypothetical protein
VPTGRKVRLAGRALRRFVRDRRSWPSTELIAPDAILGCADAVRLA